MTRLLLRTGLRPNQISMLSVVAGVLGAWAFTVSGECSWGLLAGAGLVQLRLMANLFDGLVAVEGGRATRNGVLYNEVPDRFTDVLFLVGAGVGTGTESGLWLGWLAAVGALLTAYVRVHGAALRDGEHDFSGLGAKPQRMFLLTVSAISAFFFGLEVLVWGLGLIAAAALLTFWQRLRTLNAALRGDLSATSRKPLRGCLSGAVALGVRLFTGVRKARLEVGERGRVYFARHRSHLDTLVIWAALPTAERRNLRPVAALDYWGKTRPRRWFATQVLDAILVDREPKLGRGEHPLAEMDRALEAGSSLLIFPEGQRAPGRFKSGIYHLMRRFPQVELIPVHLENLGRILPKGEFLPLPLIARAEFGTAIYYREEEGKVSFLERCEQAIPTLQKH